VKEEIKVVEEEEKKEVKENKKKVDDDDSDDESKEIVPVVVISAPKITRPLLMENIRSSLQKQLETAKNEALPINVIFDECSNKTNKAKELFDTKQHYLESLHTKLTNTEAECIEATNQCSEKNILANQADEFFANLTAAKITAEAELTIATSNNRIADQNLTKIKNTVTKASLSSDAVNSLNIAQQNHNQTEELYNKAIQNLEKIVHQLLLADNDAKNKDNAAVKAEEIMNSLEEKIKQLNVEIEVETQATNQSFEEYQNLVKQLDEISALKEAADIKVKVAFTAYNTMLENYDQTITNTVQRPNHKTNTTSRLPVRASEPPKVNDNVSFKSVEISSKENALREKISSIETLREGLILHFENDKNILINLQNKYDDDKKLLDNLHAKIAELQNNINEKDRKIRQHENEIVQLNREIQQVIADQIVKAENQRRQLEFEEKEKERKEKNLFELIQTNIKLIF
jgi:hypothetical protein